MSIVDRPSSTSPATTPTNQGVRKHRDANEHKFLSFCLGTETYGVEILKVREIIGLLAITPLPHESTRQDHPCHRPAIALCASRS